MLSDACHKRNLPLCLYYSIADWNHPNYPNQGRHHELPKPEEGDQPDWNAYMEFLKGQVRELCTNYGKIHGFWWDMNVPEHVDPSINAMIRQLQPDAVINDRGFDKGDFGTPERDYKADDARAFTTRIEACQAVGSESWGYREDEDYYTVGHLERSITRYLARGANYLLNVGPQPDGMINPAQHRHPQGHRPMDEIRGRVLRRCHARIPAIGKPQRDAHPPGQLTLHPPPHRAMTDSVKLKPFTTAPKRAVLLNNGSELPLSTALCPADHESQTGYLRVRGIPADSLANTVGVIRLDFENLTAELAKTSDASENEILTR